MQSQFQYGCYANSLLYDRMFCEPEATDSKTSVKADPTAPARSAIRRQRTVRYSPNVRDHQSTFSTLLSRSQSRSQGRARVLADRRSLLEDIRRRDRSVNSSVSNPPDVNDLEAEADLAHSRASQRSRIESGRALLRDALSYERPGRRIRITGDATLSEGPPRQVRPHGLDEIVTRTEQDELRLPPSQSVPTPPYTSGDTSIQSSPYVSSPRLGTASLTPRFAPAHRLDGEDEARAHAVREEVLERLSSRMAEMMDGGEGEYVAGHAAEINRMRGRNPAALSVEYREAEAAYLESIELRLLRRVRDNDSAELPRLRRMHPPSGGMFRRIRGSSHLGNVDGLGDRERSFSPDEDPWETMLTTIQPDAQVPSAHSSFTSATASASSLSSNSTSSFGTLITVPSTSDEVEVCPVEYDDFEEESMDEFDAQIARIETQASRIEALSQRLNQPRYRDEHFVTRRRLVEREHELQQREANLNRLEQQISDESLTVPGRHRHTGGRTGWERL